MTDPVTQSAFLAALLWLVIIALAGLFFYFLVTEHRKLALAVPYWLILRPLIIRNYNARERGELPDEWYWADRLACNWGWFTRYD